ncbi:hypothetical protein GH714_019301 [Hevea brasiliensis]|uniref:Uncharacterized protein n=1 Tax=Hevea brasiliensis TaxID=3981 RepID=A0A6A6KWJ3_HEVBR|nr:hypothetical protein GH714_019301 [Hevea brasiliensis]
MAIQKVTNESRMAFPLNTVGILREAVKLPARNGKLMLQLMIFVLSPLYFLVLIHNLVAGPLIHKIEDDYEQSSVDRNDVRSLLGIELLFVGVFSIISFCGITLIIYAASTIYIGKDIKFNDLFSWIRASWKNPLITWLYVYFPSAIYIVLVTVMIKLVSKISSSIWGWVAGILGVVFYLYLFAQWALALIVSIMEEDCGGINAVGKARKIISGREVQGWFLMLILTVISIPICVVFYVTITDDDDELGLFTQFAFGFFSTAILCLAMFFTFVVFTVFCYECEQRHGEIESEAGHSLVSHELGVHN